MRTKFVGKHKRWFLKALRQLGGQKVKAARVLGFPMDLINRAMDRGPHFCCDVESVIEEIGEELLTEGIRRAKDGVERDVYHQGEIVGTETYYSDSLLIPLLKGVLPERFKEKSELKITGTVSFAERLKEAINGKAGAEDADSEV